jgi:squalene-hopene/tetraprenyl-beta-curcumene cyclase
MRKPLRLILGAIMAFLIFVSTVVAARGADDAVGPDTKELKAVLDKAAAYLKKKQAPDGSFPVRGTGPGVTALAAAAFLSNGYSADDPSVEKAMAALEKSVQKDGGIYDKALANYTTSVALMTFVEANKGGKYDALIKNATKFLKGLQQVESGDEDVKFGGVGYDGASRPDLSNTQLFIDALLAAGVPKDDPAVKNALKFVGRCQNLPGETNDQPFAKKTSLDDKGGLTYNPIDPDKNNYKTADGGLRSLGGMTYAGLKTFLYAGVGKDDPRVKAALNWIRKHYTLDENPGMGQAGLYYYYHTFGKAMAALGEDQFADADGKKHDWRRELFEALKKRQRDDGSWINEKDKQFGEASPELATAFAMLSLSYCQPPKQK